MNKLIKISLLSLIGGVFFSCTAQKKEGYTIRGKIEGLKAFEGNVKGAHFSEGYIYLSGLVKNGEEVYDSAKVKNGSFVFNGLVDEPNRAYLYWLPKKDGYYAISDFYIENSDIRIDANYNAATGKVENKKVTGSMLDDEIRNFFTQSNEYTGRSALSEQLQKAQEAGDTAKIRDLRREFEKVNLKSAEFQQNYMSKHPNSYIQLLAFSNMFMVPQEEDKLVQLEKELQELHPDLQSYHIIKKIKQAIAEQRKRNGIVVGIQAFDFEQPDKDGNMVKLSDYKGKYVLLDFWASWCGPCRGENPHVLAAYNKFHDKGLEVLAVSMDSKKDAWLKAVEEDKLPWKQLCALKGFDNKAAELYMVRSIPTNFLISPEGEIIAINLRGHQLEEKFAELFK